MAGSTAATTELERRSALSPSQSHSRITRARDRDRDRASRPVTRSESSAMDEIAVKHPDGLAVVAAVGGGGGGEAEGSRPVGAAEAAAEAAGGGGREKRKGSAEADAAGEGGGGGGGQEEHQHSPRGDLHEPHLIRSRVANACDGCKARKVKCDGKLPCSYCTRRQRPHTCKYSPPRQRRHPRPRTQARTPSLHSPSASNYGGSDHGTVQQQQQQQHVKTLAPDHHHHHHNHHNHQQQPASVSSTAPLHGTLTQQHSNLSDTTHVKASTPIQPTLTQQQQQQQQTRPPTSSDGGDASPEDHEEAEVPREARLLCDAQGKLIFIGDCAPLSFFQTVRQLVTSRVDPNAFAPQTSRYSVLENATSRSSFASGALPPPDVDLNDIPAAVTTYLAITSAMCDLFVSESRLSQDLTLWASNRFHASANTHTPHTSTPTPIPSSSSSTTDDATSSVYYLVLALGTQQIDEDRAQMYFDYARDQALASLNGILSIETVQAFILVTIYMLCACQINGAFLFFGLAVRAAYSIGIHRTEVNARFGAEAHRQRDRIWKSLRIVDLFLSTSMGRPPCVGDVDCTVPYRQVDSNGHEMFDILNASVQIFLILEGIVLEVYSRRKITFQLTEGISRQLRDFSVRWLRQLKRVVSGASTSNGAGAGGGIGSNDSNDPRQANTKYSTDVDGACHVLATYYYAVMLVSRPFLMYELYRRLSPEPTTTVYGRAGLVSGKSKLADACIDAASLLVDQVLDLVERGAVTGRRPILVSWLFAGSLVLGAGLLGNFGRVLEKYARMALTALDHFARIDTHAAQYAMISRSLLSTALGYLEKREVQERLQRTESSAQLFGLLPNGPAASTHGSCIGGGGGSGGGGGGHGLGFATGPGSGGGRRSPEFTRKMAALASPPLGGAGGAGGTGFSPMINSGSHQHPHHHNANDTLGMTPSHMHSHIHNSHSHPHTQPHPDSISSASHAANNHMANNNNNNHNNNNHPTNATTSSGYATGASPSFFSDLDPAFLTMSSSLGMMGRGSPDLSLMNTMFDGDESSFGGLNLFPLLEGTGGGGGHIDLAHYL
ncbi:hypothetical protein BD289DRAFT_184313 [Coniella lustricola]|uniref:Zn(2)-C6 fungal-type domain-containing protein n=1 Tax=Coniella lustricola TaxID=2025994 RepID=A0A2T3ADB5_9PEZI|nr:hypothetical protein BD289DRAFT_184313 [Coniella lustricola]